MDEYPLFVDLPSQPAIAARTCPGTLGNVLDLELMAATRRNVLDFGRTGTSKARPPGIGTPASQHERD